MSEGLAVKPVQLARGGVLRLRAFLPAPQMVHLVGDPLGPR